MEQKNLKTPVFISETVFSDSAEQPIDVDFTLPDYCPDISKILKCRAIARIASKGINGMAVIIDGTVTITIIYSDSEFRLCSYEYQYPFNKSFDTGIDCDGAVISAKTKCEYINCRAVTGRKIDIHGAAGIYVNVKKRKCTEVISDVDDSNIEQLRGSIPATSPMSYNEKYLLIEDEIEIGQGQPSIRSLIRYDASAAVKECKLLSGKAMVKGEIIITLLYCPDEGNMQTVRGTIPFSQLIELDGTSEQCECNAESEISYIDIKPRVLASGEARSFQLDMKLLISCESYCNNDINVILEAYSRKYEADIIKNELCINKMSHNINESFSCKKNLEFSDGSLAAIADLWCNAKTDSVKLENAQIILNGVVMASIIAFDSTGEPIFYEKPIEFEYKHPLIGSGENIHCQPKIEVTSSSYTITDYGNMELRVELCVNASIYELTKISPITEVKTDENKQIAFKNNAAMTIYFASRGESVWNVAKKYLASVEEVKKINDITDDIIGDDQMILVPFD